MKNIKSPRFSALPYLTNVRADQPLQGFGAFFIMKLIALSKQGKNKGKYFAQVDDKNYEYLNQFNWSVMKNGKTYYAQRHEFPTKKNKLTNHRIILMHREIMKAEKGELVDHRDMNGLNCLESNMRKCNRSQNNANRSCKKNGTSNYLGVSKHITKRKNGKIDIYWAAQIKHNKIQEHLGVFKTEIEAALAYNESAKKYHGEFARLNIITF